MPTFTSFNNRLPDPTFGVNDAGATDIAGSKGPGFAKVSVQSHRPAQVSRTNSGRGVHRETASHHWEISITYNPMTRDSFDTVSSFLDARNGRMNPFFVVLPQHSKPKNPVFAQFAINNVIRASGAHIAGSPYILMSASTPLSSYPKPGDYFTINDASDINHLKAYKVSRVETASTYQAGTTPPTASQVRVHTTPPLEKSVANSAIINWIDPAFRVIQKGDVQEYELDTDNLYQFGLQLEEILP